MARKYTFFYIYVLLCDKTNDIVYVGQTVNPIRREFSHISSCKKRTAAVYKHFRKYKSKPKMEIIDKVRALSRSEKVNNTEMFWINQLIKCGYNIKNVVGRREPVVFKK